MIPEKPSDWKQVTVKAAMKKFAALALAPILSLLSGCHSGLRNEQHTLPPTIPALQEWKAADGDYKFTEHSRVVSNLRDADALQTTSRLFADELRALTRTPVVRAVGTEADLHAGDIFLSVGPVDRALGSEGYALQIGAHIAVTAPEETGVFYATRTLLQLLRQNRELPRGDARDWPRKPERGLMVDDGRKFFTPAWLHDQVRELAYFKLNTLHLHLSDNEGFRIESETHPEIVSAEHLSKKDVRELLALAAQYHVNVIPEIDMPGHMAAILDVHTDLQIYDIDHDAALPSSKNYGYIDLAKPPSYALMQDLIKEYLPLFPGPYWHIGADEYIDDYAKFPQLLAYAHEHYGASANGKDTYLGFINWADAQVRAAGKTTRAWNDGIGGGAAVTVNADVLIDFWTDHGLTAQQHVDNGHLIANQSWDPTYYVLGTEYTPDLAWLYARWPLDEFQKHERLRADSDAKNLGSMLHVWSDNPNYETETYVAGRIAQPLRVLAQRMWGAPNPVRSYSQFEVMSRKIGSHPDVRPAAHQP